MTYLSSIASSRHNRMNRGSPKPPFSPKEHVRRVGESGQGDVDHQLILVLVYDQVEDEVERVFVDD